MTMGQQWPYEEVKLSWDRSLANTIIISSPWLTVRAGILPIESNRLEKLIEKFQNQNLSVDDAGELHWFFNSFQRFPLSYSLPRSHNKGLDQHRPLGDGLDFSSPRGLLESLLSKNVYSSEVQNALEKIIRHLHDIHWTWDVDSALAFSRASSGDLDPVSLFSICRRFHLLNDLENNKTAELFSLLDRLRSNSEAFAFASSLTIRQNHYITEQCDSVLSAALPISQNAEEHVLEFISAENGHDQILEKALDSLGFKAEEIPVLDPVFVLMEAFRAIGQRNLLAFSMVVDVFERSSYRDSDPMAELLEKGGATVAADQLEAHRHINDVGGHENIATSFLSEMENVSDAYAEEAVRLAELLTIIIHQVSPATIGAIESMQV